MVGTGSPDGSSILADSSDALEQMQVVILFGDSPQRLQYNSVVLSLLDEYNGSPIHNSILSGAIDKLLEGDC